MSEIKSIFKEKINSLIEKSGLPIEQILFGAYIFLRWANNKKFLKQIKVTYQNTKIDDYFRWILDAIIFIGDFFFRTMLRSLKFYIAVVVIFFIYKMVKKYFDSFDKLQSFLYTIAEIVSVTLQLLISKVWIYYIIAKELVNKDPITLTLIDIIIIIINAIILLPVIKGSLISRFGNPLVLEKKKKENLIYFARSNPENTALYIHQKMYEIDDKNKLYYCVNPYTYKGICFKLIRNDKAETKDSEYDVLILLTSSNLSVVEKYYNFLVEKYEAKN